MYHQDLLDQAEHLALLDSAKPKQASLRRAVSAAYYGIFHYMVEEACKAQLGTQHSSKPHRRILARAFKHGDMMKACVQFRRGTLQPKLCQGLSSSGVSYDEIGHLASTFVQLQKERHRADYDFARSFHRDGVLGLIRQAEEAIKDFDGLPTTSVERAFFLACLWAAPHVRE